MKNPMKNIVIILVSTLSILFPLQILYAQKDGAEPEKNFKLKIVKEKNGKKEVIEEEFKTEKELNEYLKSHKDIDNGEIDLNMQSNTGNIVIHRDEADGGKGEKKRLKIMMKKHGDRDMEVFSDEDLGDIMALSDNFKDKLPEIRRHLHESMKDLPIHIKKFRGELGKDFNIFFDGSERDVTFNENLPESINQITKKSERLELADFNFDPSGETIGTYSLAIRPEDKEIGNLEIGIYDEAGKELFKDKLQRDKENNSFKKDYNFAGKKRGIYYVKVNTKGKTSIQKIRLR